MRVVFHTSCLTRGLLGSFTSFSFLVLFSGFDSICAVIDIFQITSNFVGKLHRSKPPSKSIRTVENSSSNSFPEMDHKFDSGDSKTSQDSPTHLPDSIASIVSTKVLHAFKAFHSSYSSLETNKLISSFKQMKWIKESRKLKFEEIGVFIEESLKTVIFESNAAIERFDVLRLCVMRCLVLTSAG